MHISHSLINFIIIMSMMDIIIATEPVRHCVMEQLDDRIGLYYMDKSAGPIQVTQLKYFSTLSGMFRVPMTFLFQSNTIWLEIENILRHMLII